MRNHKLKMMILTALFAAITAICAQIKITIGPVPFTMQTIAVALAAVILGRYGGLAILLYLIIGALGIPVFSGFKAGLPVIIGPTGGFLIGFTLAAFITGYMMDWMKPSFIKAFLLNILGLVVVYAVGVTQLKFVAHFSFAKALAAGATPFIIPDLIKIAIASYLGVLVRNRLQSAGVYPDSLKKAS